MSNRLLSRRPAAPKPVYKRIILKLSGEVLAGAEEVIDAALTEKIAREVAEIHALGVQIAVVIGGGNIWRGITSANRGMDRSTADYMGMLATIINGMAMQEALEKRLQVMVSTAFALCMDNHVPIVVFDMFKEGNLKAVILGEKIGTLVTA